MALLGQAVLAFWHDVAPGGEAEFDHWHVREHIPERISLPGFLQLRRYVALGGGPRYFYFYETESLETLRSPAYLARLNDPTPWTRRMLPLYRNNKRTACRVTMSASVGLGGTVATLELGPRGGHEDELRSWLTGTALLSIGQRPGIVGVHLLEGDAAASATKSDEKKLLGRADALVQWVVLLEGIEPEAPEGACREFLSAEALARRGADEDVTVGVYRLQYCLAR